MFEISILLFWVFCPICAALIASRRNGSVPLWFFLGFLFGPLGLLFSFIGGEDQVKCQYCRSKISEKAVRCPQCHASLAVASEVAA